MRRCIAPGLQPLVERRVTVTIAHHEDSRRIRQAEFLKSIPGDSARPLVSGPSPRKLKLEAKLKARRAWRDTDDPHVALSQAAIPGGPQRQPASRHYPIG